MQLSPQRLTDIRGQQLDNGSLMETRTVVTAGVLSSFRILLFHNNNTSNPASVHFFPDGFAKLDNRHTPTHDDDEDYEDDYDLGEL